MTDGGQLDLDGVADGESDRASATIEEATTPSTTRHSSSSPRRSSPHDTAIDATGELTSAENPEPTQPADPETGEAAEKPTADEEGPSLYFLTNRMNLNGVLSSRILAPRESFQKYYADLLELCPGWVPLLVVPPAADLIEKVLAERGAGAPVIIELTAASLNGASVEAPVTYVHSAALSDAKAIHFRDKKSLREHRARGYDNVFPHDDLLQLSPELFASDAQDDVLISAPENGCSTDWLRVDRVRGAVGAALAAADSGESLAAAAGVLGAEKLPEDVSIPPWLTWEVLSGTASAVATKAPADLADSLIFDTSYRILSQHDQSQAWSPSTVLKAVVDEIATNDVDDEARAIIQRNLKHVRQVVDVERDFEPFRNPNSPHVAAKALLMTLLRPDLGQLLEWPSEETGADATTRTVAAVLAGCLRGVARESVALRNAVLDDLTAAWAIRDTNGGNARLGLATFESDRSGTSLLIDGKELQLAPPLVPNPVTLYEALRAEVRALARVSVSRQLRWPVDVHINLPEHSSVAQQESLITITGIDEVSMEPSVEEGEFLKRLRGLGGRARARANEALTQAAE